MTEPHFDTNDDRRGYLRMDAIDPDSDSPPIALMVIALRVHGQSPDDGPDELEARTTALGQQLLAVIDATPGVDDLAMSPQAVTACMVHARGVSQGYLALARQLGAESGEEAAATAYALNQLRQAVKAADGISAMAQAQPMKFDDAGGQ